MKRRFTILTAALALLAILAIPMGMRGQTTSYEQLTSIANIDESAQYVLGIDGTGFHYEGTSSWGKVALPSAQTPLYYTLTKATDGKSFTAKTTISGTTYYLQIPTSNTFSMATSTGTNTDIIIGTTQVSETNYAVANKGTTNRHLRINGTSGLRSYAGTTGTMAFFYKVVSSNTPTYTVTYHANMTGTADIEETYNEGETVTIAGNTFVNPGYAFTEWNTEADGTGDSYNPGDEIENIDDDIDLYAQWEESSVIIDVLNWQATGSPTNYTEWTYNNTSSGAAYAGQSSGTYQSIQLRAQTPSGIVSTVSGGKVTKVTVTWNSNTANGRTVNVYGSNIAYSASSDLYNDNNAGQLLGSIVCGTSTELSISDNYAFIGLKSSSGALYLDKVEITWEQGGVIPPAITANNVNITYDATSGEIAYTLNNPASNGNLSVTENVDWISNAEVNSTESKVTFTTTANESGNPREGIITLTYTYGDNETITKDVTITQAGDPNAVMTIAEARTQTGSVATKGIVTSITGSSTKTAYIQDATAAIVVYGSFTAAVGDEIRVSGTLSDYNGLLEITTPTVTVISSNNTVEPELMTVAQVVSSTNQGWYIRVEGATVTEINGQNTTIEQDGNSIVVRGISSSLGLEEGNVISLNGNIGYFNGNQIANPQNVQVQAEEHTLTVSSLTNVNIYVFAGTESEMLLEGEGSAQVLSGIEVIISVDVETGYILQSLMVDGTDHTADIDGGTYVFTMPTHDVTITATAVVAPQPTTYTLATSILSGRTYIITDGVDRAMSAQSGTIRNAADVTIDNGVATVSSVNVHEFIISGSETDGYTLYDATTPGYLYASSSSSNNIGTRDENSDDNSMWTIAFDDESGVTITAKGENTRNIIRYNYNNGNDRFSCYASNSSLSSPLYLYMKDEPTLSIVGYENDNNAGGYYLIASPVTVDPSTVGMTTGDFDLYSFDQAQDDEWRNYKAGAFTNLEPGKGYLYAHKTGGEFTLTGTAYNGDPIVLKKTAGGDFPGWNLVGNPYTETAYIDRDFYVMNPETGGEIITGEGNEIAPMQGFFVIAANDNEELEISTTAPNTTGEKVIMNVTSNRGNVIDRAIVRFGEGRQLPKFQLRDNSTKISIAKDNSEYAVVRSEAEGEMPVSFKAENNGTYTFSVNTENVEMEYLHLIDNMTGADIDLIANPSYSFEAKVTDYASRFRLVFSANSSVNEQNANNFAFFNGNDWTINNEGEATLQVVDMTGRMLSTETINGNATTKVNAATGVYMLRLINGNNIKTQKVVVK